MTVVSAGLLISSSVAVGTGELASAAKPPIGEPAGEPFEFAVGVAGRSGMVVSSVDGLTGLLAAGISSSTPRGSQDRAGWGPAVGRVGAARLVGWAHGCADHLSFSWCEVGCSV